MDITYNFTGKTALVTGGSKGIGKAIAIAFAKAGANVAIASTSAAAGQSTVSELKEMNVKAAWYKTDVSSEESVLAMRDAVLKDFGSVDFLVNNAGIGIKHPGPPFKGIPAEEFRRIFETNAMGAVYTCKAFYDNFAARKSGKIVNIASIAGIQPSPALPQYCMSKAAIIILSECLAKEMGAFNVNVNVVNPGYVFTDIYGAGGENSAAQLLKKQLPQLFGDLTESEDIVKRLAAGSNLRRMQTPENMADAVLFLCSDAAENISGQCINVDGGIITR